MPFRSLSGRIKIGSHFFISTLIDSEGYRSNVGIILCNDQRKLFWAKRAGQDAWQFPQGGINEDETPEQAMYRELHEEVGLESHHVNLLASTNDWLKYRLPKRYMRKNDNGNQLCIGQKQRWFLLKVNCQESDFCLDATKKPEFDHWKWVKYWHPVNEVVFFKRKVYAQALREFAPVLYPEGMTKMDEYDYRPKSRRIKLY